MLLGDVGEITRLALCVALGKVFAPIMIRIEEEPHLLARL
jgi:hypothetical protein